MLAARKDPIGLSGSVLIDGATQPKNFKCKSGYVTQVSHFVSLQHDYFIFLLSDVIIIRYYVAKISGNPIMSFLLTKYIIFGHALTSVVVVFRYRVVQ